MRIENLEIKHSAVEIIFPVCPQQDCETCLEEGDEVILKIDSGPISFHAAVGTFCAEKYLRMLAQ